jgi:hypothetical protein
MTGAGNGPAARSAFAGRTARGARKGQDFEDALVCVWPGEGAARGPDAEARPAGAGWRGQARHARGSASAAKFYSVCPCSNSIFSKILNKS